MITKETEDRILKFRDDRDWRQFHNPKDLAISVSLEAAELLENFQWSAEDLVAANKIGNIREEIADVMVYCELLCSCLGLSADAIINEKMAKNEAKYAVEKAKGRKEKYTEL